MAGPAEIYGLYDPRDGELRYIGKAVDSRKRLVTHIRDSRRRKTPIACWMRSLIEKGMLPDVRVIEVATDWVEAERRLIAEARANGQRLLNLADGGNQPSCSTEVRVANGRKSGASVSAKHKDAKWKQIWRLQQYFGQVIARGELTDSVRMKLRYSAQRAPHLFGQWANV